MSVAPILTENFDSYSDGDLNGQGSWVADVLFDIQGTTIQAGAKAVKVITAGAEIQAKKTGVAQNSGSQAVYIKLAQTNQEGGIIWTDSGANQAMRATFDADGNIYWTSGDGGYQQIQAFIANQWYKILFEWSSSNHKYRVTVNNGTPTSYGTGIAINPDTADRVILDARGTGTFYFDSFGVGVSGNFFTFFK